MKEWLPLLSVSVTILFAVFGAFRWVGRQQEAREEDGKRHDGLQREVEILRKHADDINKWAGSIGEIVKAHDEELDLLRPRTHDAIEGLVANREQISRNKENIERCQKELDTIREHVRQLEQYRRPK